MLLYFKLIRIIKDEILLYRHFKKNLECLHIPQICLRIRDTDYRRNLQLEGAGEVVHFDFVSVGFLQENGKYSILI
jgi:hypothetical protein